MKRFKYIVSVLLVDWNDYWERDLGDYLTWRVERVFVDREDEELAKAIVLQRVRESQVGEEGTDWDVKGVHVLKWSELMTPGGIA